MIRRRVEEALFRVLMIGACLTVLACLALIVGVIAWRGIGALSLAMITQTPTGGFYLGGGGGIANAIVGSLAITGGATVIALALALPVALYLNLYASPSSRLAGAAWLALDILWGVPSIVYGAFGFAIMVYLGIRASLLGGMITVALLIFPVMSRAMDEVMRLLPRELLEASDALGATRLETALRVAVRQTLPGITSAVLIAMGRGIGDAASVLFTAGYADQIPRSLADPAATLPLAIFFQLGSPYPAVQERAYASAFVLTVIILTLSIVARLIIGRFKKNIVD